jgi:predicted ribosome quality control (RQC) complex YloA/Tae2 family protein
MVAGARAEEPQASALVDFKPTLEARVKELETYHQKLEEQINKLIERSRTPAESSTPAESDTSKEIEDLRAKARDVFEQYAIAKGVLSAVTITGETVDRAFIDLRLKQISTDLARVNTKAKGPKERTIATGGESLRESAQSLESEKRFWTELRTSDGVKKP